MTTPQPGPKMADPGAKKRLVVAQLGSYALTAIVLLLAFTTDVPAWQLVLIAVVGVAASASYVLLPMRRHDRSRT